MVYIILVAIALAVAGGFLFARLTALRKEHDALKLRFAPIVNADAERSRVLAEVGQEREKAEQKRREAEAELGRLMGSIATNRSVLDALKAELAAVEASASLQSMGFYKPQFDFDTSERFAAEIERVREKQKTMLSAKTAAVCRTQWTVNNSVIEGRKQIDQTLRLILRAFNGECDAAMAKVRYNNVVAMETRVSKAWEAINKLASVQTCEIVRPYLDLKLKELRLTHEYQEKVQAEKEEQRAIREQMREEEAAQREMEKARTDAEREERRYEDALVRARADVEKAVGDRHTKLAQQIAELERRLAEARSDKERALARAQTTKSGHVYVISNIGSFGEDVFKIGMTRRLDPLDRVRELGDASVPFLFDVHAVLYSDDAPALEAKLHRAFAGRRVNRVNERREFFRVSLDEIAQVVKQSHGRVELTRVAEAQEYRKTLALIEGKMPSVPEPVAVAITVPEADLPRFPVAASSGGRFVVRENGKDSFAMTDRQLLDLSKNGVISTDTDIFDVQTQCWQKGADLPAIATACEQAQKTEWML